MKYVSSIVALLVSCFAMQSPVVFCEDEASKSIPLLRSDTITFTIHRIFVDPKEMEPIKGEDDEKYKKEMSEYSPSRIKLPDHKNDLVVGPWITDAEMYFSLTTSREEFHKNTRSVQVRFKNPYLDQDLGRKTNIIISKPINISTPIATFVDAIKREKKLYKIDIAKLSQKISDQQIVVSKLRTELEKVKNLENKLGSDSFEKDKEKAVEKLKDKISWNKTDPKNKNSIASLKDRRFGAEVDMKLNRVILSLNESNFPLWFFGEASDKTYFSKSFSIEDLTKIKNNQMEGKTIMAGGLGYVITFKVTSKEEELRKKIAILTSELEDIEKDLKGLSDATFNISEQKTYYKIVGENHKTRKNILMTKALKSRDYIENEKKNLEDVLVKHLKEDNTISF